MKNSEEYQNDFSVRSDFINTSKSQLEGSANMFSPLKLLVAIAILFFAFPSCNAILAQDFVDDTITVHELKSLVSKDSIVDMGLSVDWANFNIGAKSVVDNGSYFAWGETESKTFFSKDNSKTYLKNTFELKQAGIISVNGELTPANDAATVLWGTKYRMPSLEEVEELYASCDVKFYSVKIDGSNSIYGAMFESRKNGNRIFCPFPGYYKDNEFVKFDPESYRPNTGAYWASSISNTGAADLASNIVFTRGWYYYRNVGLPVRPVVQKPINDNADIWDVSITTSDLLEKQLGTDETVDMGNGVVWVNRNLGAEHIYDYGDYFMWGETVPANKSDDINCQACGKDTAYLANSNFVVRSSSFDDYGFERTIYNIASEHDAATKLLGSNYRIPDVDELESLLYSCAIKSLRVKTADGKIIKGYLLKSKYNGKMLYFPIAGNYYHGSNFVGVKVLYWSSTMINNRCFYSDFSEMRLVEPYVAFPIRAIVNDKRK